MGFCTNDEYKEFLNSCPIFEQMLIRSDITLINIGFISDEEQERRFEDRINDPTKRWKISPMDIESRARWVDYSRAKKDAEECLNILTLKNLPGGLFKLMIKKGRD